VTLPSTEDAELQDDGPRLALVIAFAPHDELLGTVIHVDGAAILGREHPALASATRSLSRRHAAVRRSSERLVVRDLGSRFGTLVNGVRIAAAQPLAAGDVLSLGKVGFIVRRLSRGEGERPPSPVARALDAARAALDAGAVLHLHGPPGAGKRELVVRLHEAPGRGLVMVERTADIPHGPPAGTVCFPDLDAASPEIVHACAAWLRRVSRGEGESRLVVTTERGPHTAWPGELAALRGAAIVRVPPLAEAPEEVLRIARDEATRLAGRPVSLSPALAAHLIRGPSAGSVRDLRAYVAWLVSCAGPALREGGVLDVTGAAAEATRVVVALDGGSFSTPSGEVVSLSRRPVLGAVLAGLAQALGEGGELDVEALARVAWPSERMSPSSRAARVHVAIATLRRLGLGANLVRGARGYSLVDVEVGPTPRS
jgi:hypothetical protein